MENFVTRIAESAKAIVALATPIVSIAVTDAWTEFQTLAQGVIAAAATALLVYVTPHREPVA